MEELLHPDFSQWPRRAKRGEAERAASAYRPIPLQTLGNSKVSLEHAFKSLMNQICDAGAGEYVFLRCASDLLPTEAQCVQPRCERQLAEGVAAYAVGLTCHNCI